MDCLILAGGRCPDDLREATGVEYRSNLLYEGRTFLEIVSEAVQAAERTITIGGPEGDPATWAPGGKTFIESMRVGLGKVASDKFLLATCDLPFLTREAVDDFIQRCEPEAGLNYPIIDAKLCAQRYPGARRTTLKLKEGVFTGGNLALIRTDGMRTFLPILEKAYENRKKVFRLASQIGYDTLFKVLVGQMFPSTLRLHALEQKISQWLKTPVRAIVTPYVEIGTDIDNLAQYLALCQKEHSST